MEILFIQSGALNQSFGIIASGADLSRQFNQLAAADQFPAERLERESQEPPIEFGCMIDLVDWWQSEQLGEPQAVALLIEFLQMSELRLIDQLQVEQAVKR
jgi:hypothetical protein